MSSRKPWVNVLAFALVTVTGVIVFRALHDRLKAQPKDVNATKKELKERKLDEIVPVSGEEYQGSVRILYASTTGTARQFATTLFKHMGKKCPVRIEVSDLQSYNEELLQKEDIVIFICSTWEGGVPPKSAERFFDWLQEQAYDFRVSKDYLANVKFAVFGLGGAIYGKNFAKFVSHQLVAAAQLVLIVFVNLNRAKILMSAWNVSEQTDWNSTLGAMTRPVWSRSFTSGTRGL